MSTEWIDGFDADEFSLKSGLPSSGVTLDSIRLVEMISSLVNDKTLGEKAQKKLQVALKNLVSLAGTAS